MIIPLHVIVQMIPIARQVNFVATGLSLFPKHILLLLSEVGICFAV